ncbi:MAG TPA: cell wall hydrolase [Caulobacteraceae bacterium]|nr:cell wall hydrolase [Caulobacteraceae bacterium]
MRAVRLADAAAQGFSEHALQAEMLAMGPAATALAQRQDPFPSQSLRGRVSAPVITQSDDGRASAASPQFSILSASLTHARGPAAQPFRFADGGALESTRDLACLTDAVYYEARGEGSAGQAAVAQVVLNRVRHPAFPKSVCGVVFQRAESGYGCQFSFVCDGSMHHQREPDAWRRAEEVAARALDGTVMAAIGNATHFHVAGVNPGWGPRLLRVAQVGLHVFYRFGGQAGGPGAFNGAAQRSAPGVNDNPNLPTADGAPAGQFILASATTPVPASTPPAAAQAPATPSQAKTAVPAAATPTPAAKTSAPEPSHSATIS